MKPCITTWPAIVPTEEEAKPEASRAMPKTVAALIGDQRLEAFEGAVDRVDAGQAAAVEERGGDDHHREVDHAGQRERDDDVDLLEAEDLALRSASSRPTIRRWVSAECR